MATELDPDEEIARLKAARQLGGFRTPEALAEAMNEQGLGAGTLKQIESKASDRRLRPRERDAIAKACGLPAAFFTAPRSTFGAIETIPAQLHHLAALDDTPIHVELVQVRALVELMLTRAGVTPEEQKAVADAANYLSDDWVEPGPTEPGFGDIERAHDRAMEVSRRVAQRAEPQPEPQPEQAPRGRRGSRG